MVSFFPTREVIADVFGWEVRWYGLLYIIAFAVAWVLVPRLQRYRGLNLLREDWLAVFAWAAVGVLIGGRLGYVMLYEPVYFFEHPGEIFRLWQGGMSAHGGFIGVGLGVWFASRQLKTSFLRLLDILVVPVALGLALGRIGNWINQELFDPPALAWLAVGKNVAIVFVSLLLLNKTSNQTPGRAVSLFLILYSILRWLIEYVRVQEFPLIEIAGIPLTRGQVLTIPLLAVGLLLFWFVSHTRRHSP